MKAVGHILIVDDEIKDRKLLELLLQHEGYSTQSATSGDEAIALIERRAPDLILLDVKMPCMDGYEVVRVLKSHPTSFYIPIIMISALTDRESRLEGLLAGAEDFLAKPFHHDELSLRVRNLLRLKSDADQERNNNAILAERILANTIDLQKFRTAMDATVDSLALIDRGSMRYIEVNTAACRLSGYSRAELLATGPAQLSGANVEDLAREFDAIIAGENGAPHESLLRRKDGTIVSIEVNRQALQTADGWTIVSVGRDITERKKAEERLQQLAHYDPLTQLPNRRLFQQSLAKAIERAAEVDQQVVLMYLDLDNFKDINDSLGHAKGDELLRGIGDRLLSTLLARDTVGRLGGDEFGVILITPRNPDIAQAVAQKIHDALLVPIDISGDSVVTSASIGITVYPNDTTDINVLARHADMAMYEAKRAGRNTTRFYTPAMNERVGEKLQLVAALRKALAHNEFVLHYQPKVSLQTGKWTGVEALLRWNRPGYGLVPPNAFIPTLEESGLIVPVGAWVIATACNQLADWLARGMDPLPIAVNVSAMQVVNKHATHPRLASGEAGRPEVEDSELLAAISSCVEKHAVAPGMMEIEITESVVMADAEHSIALLRKLRAMGMTLSVDDFGTGYSSLSYLHRFPLASLKIDGSFIRDVTTSAEAASIAVAIIEMAHRLKLKVIAECVETEAQVQFLQAHDCEQAQGYYFAKPMPIEELEAVWKKCGGDLAHLVKRPVDLHEVKILSFAWPECKKFVDALLTGARGDCVDIVEEKLAQGEGMVAIERQIIQPALYLIGEKWRAKQISVADEHLATALALSVMAHGFSLSQPAMPNGKKVLLACMQGNQHTVGLQMVADAFTLAGWQVDYLGANVPLEALVDHTKKWIPDLLGLSTSLPEHVSELHGFAQRIKHEMGDKSPHILVGGMGLAQAGMDGAADGLTWICGPAEAVAAGERLCLGNKDIGSAAAHSLSVFVKPE